MFKVLHSVLVPVILVFLCFNLEAQTNEERRERADKFFEKEKYVEATSDYLHLLSLEPRDADLNFRYGACLLFNSNKKSESIRYLKYATTESSIDPRAFYFYGLALHLNYQFSEAQTSYGTYLNLTMGKSDPRYPVDRQIEMCNNGKRLLTTFTDIIVAEKQEIDNQKFFRIYTDENTIGGDILVTAKFQSKLDIKMGHVPIVHFPPNAQAIYYSSYGDNLSNGLDIYVRRKLPNGEWGDPQPVPGMINTRYDEDFPYMHPSGKYLYFSSTGHNSMGGYDIYLSLLDPNTNTFREPENVDFAISSPDDDFFYVVDSLFQNAYFASARQSQDGMLHVYRVKVARVPLKEVIIMGEFISEVDPNLKAMDINLTYHTNGKDVGLVRSNKAGKYSYVFPQGGKYNYLISVEGLPEEFKFTVDLPFLDELRPLKQQIIHTKEDGKDVLRILNLFDEDVEGAEAIIADVIRKKAQLDVNIQDFDVNALEEEAKNKAVLAELGFANMSPIEAGNKLHELIDVNSESKEVNSQIIDNIDAEILAKSERVVELNEIEEELRKKALQTEDPITKHRLLNEASQKAVQKESLLASTEALIALKSDVKSKLSNNTNTNDLAQLKSVSTQYDKLIDEGKVSEGVSLLAENKLLIRNIGKGTPEDLLNSYVSRASELRQLIKEEGKKETAINNTIEAANQEINRLQGLIEVSKNKDIPALQRQISDKKEEIEMAREDLKRSKDRKVELNRELGMVESQIASLQNAMSAEDHIAVNQNKLNESIASVNAIAEQETVVDYEAEIKKIEEKSPALFNTNATAFESIKTNLTKDISAIDKVNGLSEAQKLAQQEELMRNTLLALEQREEKINEELVANPSDELKREKDELKAYERVLAIQLEETSNKLTELRASEPDIAYSKTDVQKEIAPELENTIKSIENSDRSELKKVEAIKEALSSFESDLKSEQSRLTNSLNADPENSEMLARKELVSELITDTEKRISKINQREVAARQQEEAKKTDPEAILPGYNELLGNLSAIQNEGERNTEELKLQNSLKDRIVEKRKELDKQLKKTPENTAIKNEIVSLDLLANSVNERIEELQQEKAQFADARSVEKYSEAATYIPDYQKQKEQILAGNETKEVQLEKLKALNEKLIQRISEEMARVRKTTESDPNDQLAMRSLAAIEEYDRKIRAEIEEIEKSLNSGNELAQFNFNSTEELLKTIDPDFNRRVEQLEKDPALTEIDRSVALTNEFNALKESINSLESKIDNMLASDPSSSEKRDAKLMLSELEKTVDEKLAMLNTSDLITYSEETVLPGYEADRRTIIQNYSGSDQADRLLELERKLSVELNELIDRAGERIEEDPNDQKALEEKRALLQLEESNYKRIKELEAVSGQNKLVFESKEELIVSSGINELNELLAIEPERIDQSEAIEIKKRVDEAIRAMNDLRKDITDNPENSTRKQQSEEWASEIINELEQLKSQLPKENAEALAIAPDDLLKNYSNRKETIESDNSLAETARLNALTDLDEELIASARKEIQSLDKKIQKSPNDENLKAEKSVINELITAAESRNAEREQVITALAANESVQSEDSFVREKEINALVSNYSNRKANLTDGDIAGRIELEMELLAAINTRINALTKANDTKNIGALESWANDQTAIIEQLKQADYAQLNEEDKSRILSEILPEYAQKSSELKAKKDRSGLLELEQELGQLLADKQSELEKKRAKKGSVAIDLELYRINQLIQENKARIEELKNVDPLAIDETERQFYLEELRSISGVNDLDETKLTTEVELQKADELLAEYERQLDEEISVIKSKLTSDPTEGDAEKLGWLEEEKVNVQQRRRKISIMLGDIERTVLTNNSPEIERINGEINEQKKLLATTNDGEERRKIEEEIARLEEERTVAENKETVARIENDAEEMKLLLSNKSNENSETIRSVADFYEEKSEEDQRKLSEIASIEDPNYQAYELEQYQARKDAENAVLRDIVLEERAAEIEEKASIQLFSKDELEQRKRKFVVRLGELQREIAQINTEIDAAKKGDKVILEGKKELLEKESALVREEIERLEARILQLPEEQLNSVAIAMAKDISYTEERKIAMSDTYNTYEPVAKLAVDKANEIDEKENELKQLREQLAEELLLELSNESQPGRKEQLIDEIAILEEEVDRLRISLIQDTYKADQLLPANEDEAMKMKNLVARGVKPIKASVVAASLLSMPAEGFAIGEKLEPGAAREVPIAVGVEYPEGLVYRVQVGAFARPIPAELFSEFTPVSGEKIEGTNITRYMAGYFNSSSKVVEAREQIRGLGYNDAFIIAYCNGKRINFGDARRLEEQGICVPKRENELMLEVAENTAKNLGVSLEASVAEVKEHDYNKAPGAVPADAIEEMQGLFFTVQIGVFNRPVDEKNLKMSKEILTFRLPNGQIRYSTGIFKSVEEAKPRRTDALNAGVVGAFITAYYNGERIALWEANKLLEEKGSSILYKSREDVKVTEPENVVPVVQIKEHEEVKPIKIEEQKPRVQIVSKLAFDEFPRDILNRYNTEGTFYFDETDRKVKSIIYQDEEHLPRLFNFRKDIDTLYLDEIQVLEASSGLSTISISIDLTKVPGDLMDWLLRLNHRRTIEVRQEGIEVQIYDIREAETEQVADKLRSFGYNPEVREQETSN